MRRFTVRPLRPDDIGKMADLLNTRAELDQENTEKRLRLFEWLAFRNPFADGEATYFVAEDDGRIIAHLGRMPMEFVINGKSCRGYFVHDLFVHPEYREKGEGFFISISLYKAVEKDSGSFCCLVWTTDLNLEMQKRRGYHELWADRYFKFFDPYAKLKKVIRQDAFAKVSSIVLKTIFRWVDSILLRSSPVDVRISKIGIFDSRFDNLSQRLSSKIGISPLRTSSYLNWRFLGRPFSKIEVLAAEKDGQVMGFVVVSLIPDTQYPEGELVDIMADPEDTKTISALFGAAIEYFREKKVYSIKCCLTDKRFSKVLQRFLFLRDFTGMEPVMLANLEKCEHKKYLTDMNNWHLTYGASDQLMLEP
jgi:GNAT superfamily N-acetyltransferase